MATSRWVRRPLQRGGEVGDDVGMASSEFGYLAERIADASVVSEPFEHIYVRELFTPDHLDRIISDPQVHFGSTRTNAGLLLRAARAGYRPQEFPGCTTNVGEYLWRLRTGRWPVDGRPVEGYGMTLRLRSIRSAWLASLIDYLNGPEFVGAIIAKFDLKGEQRVETAVQKYLSGYEISPHPDTRHKTATYMVNINDPGRDFPSDLHTHLMRFKPDYEWVAQLWESNQDIDRCWVPWDWCETVSMTVDNNAMVMFAPNDRTLHAVKLSYDHRTIQRTQLYGNLWSKDSSLSSLRPVRYAELEARRQRVSTRQPKSRDDPVVL